MLEDLWLKNYLLHTYHFSIFHPCLLRRERSSNIIGCHFSESLKKATAPNTQIKWLVVPSAIGELGAFTQPQSKVDQFSGEIRYVYLPYVVISSMYRLQLVPHSFGLFLSLSTWVNHSHLVTFIVTLCSTCVFGYYRTAQTFSAQIETNEAGGRPLAFKIPRLLADLYFIH